MGKRNFSQEILTFTIIALLVGLGIIPQTIALGGEKTSSSIKLESEPISLNVDTVIEVEIIEGIQVIIKNVGGADAVNVEWEIWLECPFFLISPGKQNGTIDMLEIGGEEIVQYKTKFLFGFGALKQRVIGKADNSNDAADTEKIGFLLGPFILFFPNFF